VRGALVLFEQPAHFAQHCVALGRLVSGQSIQLAHALVNRHSADIRPARERIELDQHGLGDPVERRSALPVSGSPLGRLTRWAGLARPIWPGVGDRAGS
jgi:hypothetical protein